MGVALRDILADYKTEQDWREIGGTAAVDAHNALYQFLSIIRQPDGTPLMDERGRVTSHLSGILFRCANLIEKGIRPAFVFDGAPPDFKKATVEERRKIRTEAGEAWREALSRGDTEEAYRQARSSSVIDAFILSSSKELLDALGIPWVQAPSEGEAQAAYMAMKGDVGYAVSQDYDSLLFGAPVLIRNLTVSGKRKFRNRTITFRPERILLREVLEGLALDREQLIEIALLVGTDFNPGVKGIGAKTALKLVKNRAFKEISAEKMPGFDPEPLREFFLHPPVTDTYEIRWGVPDGERVVALLCKEFSFSEERVSGALAKLGTGAGQKTLDQWFS